MKKRVLTIADADQEYLNYLARFVQTSDYTQKFLIKTFTDAERLKRFLMDHSTDILLIHHDFPPIEESLTTSSIKIQLVEKSTPYDSTDLNSVYKYQPFTLLFQAISEFIQQNGKNTLKEIEQIRTRVISIFSPTGGVGKTTVALNLSKLLAENDYRVFYLNLEHLSSVYALLQADEADPFSKLIYDMYTQPEKKAFLIEQAIRFDSRYKFFYFPPLQNSQEILEITHQMAEKLLISLDQSRHFDYIIIDLDSCQFEGLLHILRLSEMVLWIGLEDWSFQSKNRVWLELTQKKDPYFYQALLTKTYYVLNKYLGQSLQEEGRANLSYDYYLPYIPEWKQTKSIQSMLQSSTFKREMYHLYGLLHQAEIENLSSATASTTYTSG